MVPKWYGTNVTLAWGSVGDGLGDLVGGAVVQQAVPEPAVLAARDEHADLGLGRRRASSATTSSTARSMRRSGQSTISSGSRTRPSRCHSSLSALGPLGVDGDVHGPQLVGQQRAGVLDGPGRATGRGSSTSTSTEWRRRIGASTAASRLVRRARPPRPRTGG